MLNMIPSARIILLGLATIVLVGAGILTKISLVIPFISCPNYPGILGLLYILLFAYTQGIGFFALMSGFVVLSLDGYLVENIYLINKLILIYTFPISLIYVYSYLYNNHFGIITCIYSYLDYFLPSSIPYLAIVLVVLNGLIFLFIILVFSESLYCIDEIQSRIIEAESNLSYWVKEGQTLRESYWQSGLKNIPTSSLTGTHLETKKYFLQCLSDSRENVQFYENELAKARSEQGVWSDRAIQVSKRPLEDDNTSSQPNKKA